MKLRAPRSLEEYTEGPRSIEPESSVFHTRMTLNDFANTIARQKSCHLMVPFGKAYFLFYDILRDLSVYGFTYGVLKMWFYPKGFLSLNVSSPRTRTAISLVVDSIDDGDDIMEFYQTIGKRREIGSVFAYLVNSKGLRKLKEEGFPVEKIVAKTIVKPSEYRRHYDNIQIFLQSRIQPMVEGATYDIYMASGSMKRTEFEELIKGSLASALSCNEIKIDKDNWLHVPKNTHGYSYDCVAVNDCKKNAHLFAKIPFMEKLDFEVFKLGIKVECREQGIAFRVAALCPLDCSLEGIVPENSGECPYKKNAECRLEAFRVRDRKVVRTSLCDLCVNNVVSGHILNMVKEKISSRLNEKKIEFSCCRVDPL